MFFFSILSSNVFRVYIFNATLIINLNHISQTNTYPLNLYKMKMVRESILDIDFKKLMQMNRTRYLLIVFSEKITYILYVSYLRKTFQTMPTMNYDISFFWVSNKYWVCLIRKTWKCLEFALKMPWIWKSDLTLHPVIGTSFQKARRAFWGEARKGFGVH